MEYVYAINEDQCIECGSCRRYCPIPNAVIIDADYQHVIDPSLCTGCGICEAFCPVPETIFKVATEAAQSLDRLRALRRSMWRTEWDYESHPVMGPVTEQARTELKNLK